MVRTNATEKDLPREPIKIRNKSRDCDKRRNSVSEITDYLNKTQMQMAMPVKSSNKSKNKEMDANNKENSLENNEMQSQETPLEVQTEKLGEKNDNSLEELNKDNSNDALNMVSGENNDITEKTLTKAMATQTKEDLTIKAINDLRTELKKLDCKLNDPKNGVLVQLAKTQTKVSEIYTDIHGAVDGLKTQMDKATKKAEENAKKILSMENSQKRMALLLDENKRLADDMRVMQGLVQKVSQQTHHASEQITDITKRGMEQNLILHGVDDQIEKEFFKKKSRKETSMYTSIKECCKFSALQFFKQEMDVTLDPEDVWKAHRTGAPRVGKVRPLILKLSYAAKDLVMEHLHKLKGKKNPNTEQTYFISEQAPEGYTEVCKQNSEILKSLQQKNEKRPENQRSKITMINKQDHNRWPII